MYLKRLELKGFKSFAKKSEFVFDVPVVAVVGPNGSGKSNIVESIRFVLGEQSVKSMRGKTGSDLIFKGSRTISKMSRASVSIVFDNRDRVFNLHDKSNSKIDVNFDEVVISREVFSDGTNRYMVNDHEVRMKDIHELIASVNIGASGHHIISQGEADRYLNANVKDRRILIEEALGLKIYQFRLKESRRKLEKAEVNIRESEILRRELSPHLKFLKKQVNKIEKGKQLRIELSKKYNDYFSKEDYLIENLTNKIEIEKKYLENKLNEVKKFFLEHKDPEKRIYHKEDDLIKKKQIFIQDWQGKIDINNRELGKIEGMLSLLEKKDKDDKANKSNNKNFSYIQIDFLFKKILSLLSRLNDKNILKITSDVEKEFDKFINVDESDDNSMNIDNSLEIKELKRKKNVIVDATKEAFSYISELKSEINLLEKKIVDLNNEERESQKQYYGYVALNRELDSKREILSNKIDLINKRVVDRNEEYNEAIVLLGKDIFSYQRVLIDSDSLITEYTQEKFRRDIERIKIKIEDIGGGSGIDVIKEYEETLERDVFLENEILDVKDTIKSLESIIKDLKLKLDLEFNTGIEKINVQFNKFFKLMFGGGSAKLESLLIKKRSKKNLEEDPLGFINEDDTKIEKEYGIDIKVNLPRKKVSALEMLSGGERSLTSIALLFALSQVNPPPFLVLDETDAALDEANSQKYGDMIETLSKFSQLILVTHNRETMSRAHTLFGVTLGKDDSSTVLSLRLEDATKYAK